MSPNHTHHSDFVASGDELYDRLEPLPSASASPVHAYSMMYDDMTYTVLPPRSSSSSHFDMFGVTSLDYRGMSRSSSTYTPRPQTGVAMATQRQHSALGLSGHSIPLTGSSEVMRSGLTRSMQEIPQPNRWSSASRYRDSTSPSSVSVSGSDGTLGRTDAPVRGQGLKDRTRTDRGGSYSNASGGSTLSSVSPDLIVNGFATLPCRNKAGTVRNMSGNVETSHGSLENLRLSDSEVNMAFRRDNPGRISITKKSE